MSATSTSNRALVLGKGASGAAAAALLRARGYAVDFAEDYALVVASPGLAVKSELQLGCEELKRRGWKLLAVTGSKGKSSVVKLVADAITLAGGRAVPCGNYGRPVTDLFGEEPGWAVVEVSSFQLETTTLPPDTFEAAAILNLQEDHLDRHGSVEVYHGLKNKLLGFAKNAVQEFKSSSCSSGSTASKFDSLIAGSYFDNGVLRDNGRAAGRLMEAAGLSADQIRTGFRGFEPLPHRMNLIGVFGGVSCIDDSKATSVSALIAGVSMANGPVRLIAGGLPKGDDPKAACKLLTRRVKKVYLIGTSAETFASAWKDAVDCQICGTLEKAVAEAMRESVTGETILLSPGTASFDQFKSFGERGDVFADLVKKEGQKK